VGSAGISGVSSVTGAVISGRSFWTAVFWVSTESNEDKRELRYRSVRVP
jgi:hypothetical protein